MDTLESQIILSISIQLNSLICLNIFHKDIKVIVLEVSNSNFFNEYCDFIELQYTICTIS